MSDFEVNFSLNEYRDELKPMVFGFDKIKKDTLVAELYELNDTIRQANDLSYQMFCEMLGEEEAKRVDANIPNDAKKQVIIRSLHEWIKSVYTKKSFVKDGVCLRENIINCAVRLKYDVELFGFISKLDDTNSRFVYVDFGNKDGEVKIDVDEIIIAERTQ